MRELSLNILDIAQNSISAGASLIEIEIIENTVKEEMYISINDNGKGMAAEQVLNVTDPFFTTRTTRKVGMGIPLFKLAAEQTGGSLTIWSEPGTGTKISALFKTGSVDFTPLGDISSTVTMLIVMNTDRDFCYRHSVDSREFTLKTQELKQILGDVPLSTPDVAEWLKSYIEEQTQIIHGGVLK